MAACGVAEREPICRSFESQVEDIKQELMYDIQPMMRVEAVYNIPTNARNPEQTVGAEIFHNVSELASTSSKNMRTELLHHSSSFDSKSPCCDIQEGHDCDIFTSKDENSRRKINWPGSNLDEQFLTTNSDKPVGHLRKLGVSQQAGKKPSMFYVNLSDSIEDNCKNSIGSVENSMSSPIVDAEGIGSGIFKKEIGKSKGPSSYTCNTCSKVFKKKSNWQVHLQRHAGIKPFECYTCSKAFAAKTELVNHIRIHTGERPYECPVCQKAFSENGKLNKHIRMHTGERALFICDLCQKAYTSKQNFIGHRRTHTGEKPFECDTCQKSFTKRSIWKKHLQVHMRQDKQFVCSYCGRAYKLKWSLHAHLRRHTTTDPTM